jgi:hypothetical protein
MRQQTQIRQAFQAGTFKRRYWLKVPEVPLGKTDVVRRPALSFPARPGRLGRPRAAGTAVRAAELHRALRRRHRCHCGRSTGRPSRRPQSSWARPAATRSFGCQPDRPPSEPRLTADRRGTVRGMAADARAYRAYPHCRTCYALHRPSMKVAFSEMGHSLALRVHKVVAQEIGASDGKTVEMSVRDGKRVIEMTNRSDASDPTLWTNWSQVSRPRPSRRT